MKVVDAKEMLMLLFWINLFIAMKHGGLITILFTLHKLEGACKRKHDYK